MFSSLDNQRKERRNNTPDTETIILGGFFRGSPAFPQHKETKSWHSLIHNWWPRGPNKQRKPLWESSISEIWDLFPKEVTHGKQTSGHNTLYTHITPLTVNLNNSKRLLSFEKPYFLHTVKTLNKNSLLFLLHLLNLCSLFWQIFVILFISCHSC